jgi:hypothetical protein
MSNRRLPLAEVGVLIGKTPRWPRQTIMGTFEDTYVMYAGPRTGKTAAMSGMLLDAPGFGLSTSTRPDVWGHTSIPRSRKGPVLTLDVDPFSGIGSSLAWDLLDGCVHPSIAIERAGYLMHAAPRDKSGKDAFWDAMSATYLRLLLHAGELDGANILDVLAWARDTSTMEPVSILYRNANIAAPGWAEELAAFAAEDEEYRQNVARGVLSALGWLSDPAMAAIACPSQEKSLDVWKLLEEGGTIYLIGANKPHGSIAAYNACLTSHVWETGKRRAGLSPGFRLDPPALFVIDEPAITCPVALDRWLAEGGGWGMPIVTGVQSPAQLVRQWGAEGARIIRDCATIEMVFGGNTDPAELEANSSICGMLETWDYDKKKPRETRLYPPERIRTLEEGHAVVLHRNARPVQTVISRVWDRADYEPATMRPITPTRPVFPDGTPVITGTATDVVTREEMPVLVDGRS